MLELDFSEPYLETTPYGGPNVPGVPAVYPISIGTHPYLVDTEFKPYLRDAFRHRSIVAQREAVDFTNIPGEATVNTEGLWRRSMEDWILGAGQLFLDRHGSAPNRFYKSKGVDPWTQWQLTLLPETRRIFTAAGPVIAMEVGTYIYVLQPGLTDQQGALQFSGDGGATWTNVTGFVDLSAVHDPLNNMVTNGYDIWVAAPPGGVFHTTAGSATASSFATGTVDSVFIAGTWVLASNGPAISVLDSSGAIPPPLYTHPNSAFRWVTAAQGSSQVYLGGYVPVTGQPGQASAVYRSTAETNGANLSVPVVALPLEQGEFCTALYGYLNYVFVGTNLGVRMCRPLSAYDPQGNQGDLEAGPLVPNLLQPVTFPVTSFVGNNRFVYFSWTDYDTDSTGLGRMDLSHFVDSLAPAYASDRMVSGQGTVRTLDWSGSYNSPLIAVDGYGVYVDAGFLVPSGYVDSPDITYGIPDDKLMLAGDITTRSPQVGNVTLSLSLDDGPFQAVVTEYGQQPSQSPFAITARRGALFRSRITLTSTNSLVSSQCPTLLRWTVKAHPTVTAGRVISAPLILHDVVDPGGVDYTLDPYAEYAYLEALREAQAIVTYTEGPLSLQVFIDEIDWLPFRRRDAQDAGGYQADCVVYLKTWSING